LRSEQYAHPVSKPLIPTPMPALRDTLHKLPPHFPLNPAFRHPSTTAPGKQLLSNPPANRKAV
jgi:hypothetical protein